jgi:uncharacterized protein
VHPGQRRDQDKTANIEIKNLDNTAGEPPGLQFIDHHCHGVTRAELQRLEFELLATESDWPAPAAATHFDTQLGFGIRRWCSPVLGLEPHAGPEEYLRRRAELGPAEVSRRLLAASGIDTFLVDTGFGNERITTPDELAAAAGGSSREVVRLETVAERLAAEAADASSFASAYAAALAEATAKAVGVKSVIAYRLGLDFDPARPSAAEVRAAAGGWLRQCELTGQVRLNDPVLLRHVLWTAVDRRLPIQFHVGYGDSDIQMFRNDPTLMSDFIRAVRPLQVDLMLLHCYPYHRQAGYLAHVYPHVYMDVGCLVHYAGPRAPAILAESLELTPFHKTLFSSDAYGLPELYLVAARGFRLAWRSVVGRWVAEGAWSRADAQRVERMIGRQNAQRVYKLGGE